MAGTAVFQSDTLATPGAGIVVHTDAVNGTVVQIVKFDIGPAGTTLPLHYALGTGIPVASVGTFQALGTYQPLAGSVHIANVLSGTVQTHGTGQVLGTVQPLAGSVHIASTPPGTTQIIGTVQPHGTAQALGTFQPLAGSVHVANTVSGTVQTHGTVPVGTVAGTVSVLGTFQPLAGSVHVANTLSGTVQTHGTSQALGTFQPLAGSVHLASGTVSVLGTIQPLAGSVHVATNLAGGTVVSVGSAVHGAVADTRPHLISAFGSSGTQAAVDDGDAVRLWADLNGRLWTNVQTFGGTIGGGTIQVHGTVPIGTVAGTVSALGTFQPLAGSVHIASALAGGTVSIAGSVWGGTFTVINGTVGLAGGTQHVGSVQRLAGTVLTRPYQAGEGFFGSVFTAAVTNGTLVPAPGAGTFVRVWDLIASGSGAGTAFFEFGDGTPFGHIFTAEKGGLSFNSARGVRTNAVNHDILFNCAAGTWGVSIAYTLETA